jgi:hypothetical protein
VIDDISHEGLRVLLREEGVSFRRVKTWKTPRDPDYAAKKARAGNLSRSPTARSHPRRASPQLSCAWTSSARSTFGPAPVGNGPNAVVDTRILIAVLGPGGGRLTPDRTGSGTCSAAFDLGKDQLYGHIKKTRSRSRFLEFCRYLRSLHPADVRIAIVCDNYSPHLTTKRCRRVTDWAEANNVEIAYTPTNGSWPNRIEPSSPHCVTSPSMAPTTPATRNRAA